MVLKHASIPDLDLGWPTDRLSRLGSRVSANLVCPQPTTPQPKDPLRVITSACRRSHTHCWPRARFVRPRSPKMTALILEGAAPQVGFPKRRRRAGIACTRCHHRKVRCDLARGGSPCTNCRLDSATCTNFSSGKKRG